VPRPSAPPPRATLQDRAIREVVEEAARPLSPREVHEAARARVPRLGLATVYRRLAALLAEGWLVRVELPGSPPRYERADLDHHHHFHCEACDRLYELAACPGTPRLDRAAPAGFEVRRHEVLLYGLCPRCVPRKRSRRRR
jgi:Fur family ferric uptake transcriptional regulator